MRTTISSNFVLRPIQVAVAWLRPREQAPAWADSMDFDGVTVRDRWMNADDTVERAMAQMDDTAREPSNAEH